MDIEIKKIRFLLRFGNYFRLISFVFFIIFSNLVEVLVLGLMLPMFKLFENKSSSIAFGNFFTVNFGQYGLSLQNITLLYLFIVLLSLALRVYALKRQIQFSHGFAKLLKSKILNSIFGASLTDINWFGKSFIISTLYNKTESLAYDVIQPILNLLQSFFMLLFIIIILLLSDGGNLILFGFIFFVVYSILAKYQGVVAKYLGEELAHSKDKQLLLVNNSIDDWRNIIFNGSASKINSQLVLNEDRAIFLKTKIQITAIFPKFFIESLVLIILFLVLLNISSLGPSKIDAAYILFIAVIGQKTIPVIHQIYHSIIVLSSSSKVIDDVFKLVNLNSIYEGYTELGKFRRLEIRSLTYSYPGSSSRLFNNLSFNLSAGEWVGIVGRSGAGKSTLLNLMLGVLDITNGKIIINDCELNKTNRKSWHSKVSYVPQEFSCAYGKLIEVISSGDYEIVDVPKIKDILSNLGLSQLIEQDINLNFYIHENGTNLSGGQRQRLNIARSLYKDPEIIFLDEFTSALDDASTLQIVEYLKSKKDLTVVYITHDANLLKYSDFKIVLQ